MSSASWNGIRIEEHMPFDPTAFRSSSTFASVGESQRPLLAGDEDNDDAASYLAHSVKYAYVCVVISCACTFVLIVIIFSFLYRQATSEMHAAGEAAAPYIHRVLNTTMHILSNADMSSDGIAGTMGDVRTLTRTTVPAVERVLNQTNVIVSRLEALAAHPVLRLSIGSTR